jgi:Lrp/AsnC family leucine-responsive transcriptional regulator
LPFLPVVRIFFVVVHESPNESGINGLDATDLQILDLLERDAHQSNASLAAAVGLTASTVHERVKKLEKRGVITGYVALLDPVAVGRPITAFIRVMVGGSLVDSGKEGVAGICRNEPEILECHRVAGEDCYVLKARTTSPQGLERLVDRIRSDPSVQRTVTAIVLSTAKESHALSLLPAGNATGEAGPDGNQPGRIQPEGISSGGNP